MIKKAVKTKKKPRVKRQLHPNSLANLKPQGPGNDGNGGGRPPGVKNRSTIVQKWFSVEIKRENPVTKEKETLSIEDACTLSMIKEVIENGNVSAYNALNDDAYGKLKEPVEQGGKIEIEVSYVNKGTTE